MLGGLGTCFHAKKKQNSFFLAKIVLIDVKTLEIYL